MVGKVNVPSKWIEKYRPKHIKDILLPKEYKEFFKKIIETKNVPNMLLYGNKGRGKTSVALALVNDLDAEVYKINASLDTKMDLLREEISDFAMRVPIGKPKIVIFDEFDSVTFKFQAALRGLIEESAKSTSFIFTCNNRNKIINALREGRTMELDFNFNKGEHLQEITKQIFMRCRSILEIEKIPYDIETLWHIVDKYSPSIREIYSILQKTANMYGAVDNKIGLDEIMEKDTDQLTELIKSKDFGKFREYVLQKNLSAEFLLEYLFEDFMDSLTIKEQRGAIITLANYESAVYNSKFPLMQVFAAVLELMDKVL